jgi:hypothetical protein
LLCFALALWIWKDPILKERLFGLTNSEGNHGEGVKEYYFYLDNMSAHSYLKYLYLGPDSGSPVADLGAGAIRSDRKVWRQRSKPLRRHAVTHNP